MKNLIVTVDSLRYDHYRYMGETREFLGESHPAAFSTATATLGAFPTMFTGKLNVNHSIDPSESFVNEMDCFTIGITANQLTKSEYGYSGGFDSFSSPVSRGEVSLKDKLARWIPGGLPYRIASESWSQLQRAIDSVSETPKSFRRADSIIDEFIEATEDKEDWFGWLHFMEPHHPYDPDNNNLSRSEAQRISRKAISNGETDQPETVRELYRQEVLDLDEKLSRLWDVLPADTRIIFAADHGEMLGENGIWGHPGNCFHPDILRIPFATNIKQESPVRSFIDISALVLNRNRERAMLTRDVARASMTEIKCACNQNHIATESSVLDLKGNETSDIALVRELNSFDSSGITKQDGLEEDLKALGYLE